MCTPAIPSLVINLMQNTNLVSAETVQIYVYKEIYHNNEDILQKQNNQEETTVNENKTDVRNQT